METKLNEVGGIRIAATLIGLVCASAAGAQQRLDTANLAEPSVQAASCAEVAWESTLLERYPTIGEGCQEVVIAEGRRWARFEADLVQNNRDGSVTLDFKNRQGESIDELRLMPSPGQRVSIQGQTYRFSELTPGQELNLYVPEGIFAVASEPGAPAEQLAQIVLQKRIHLEFL